MARRSGVCMQRVVLGALGACKYTRLRHESPRLNKNRPTPMMGGGSLFREWGGGLLLGEGIRVEGGILPRY